MYTAPLGVSRLVAVLEDKREAVRSGMDSYDGGGLLADTKLQKVYCFSQLSPLPRQICKSLWPSRMHLIEYSVSLIQKAL